MKPVLTDVIERIRVTAKVSQADWCDLLNVHWSEYQLFKAGEMELQEKSLESLAENFSLSIEDIVSGKLDYIDLALKTEPKVLSLPERYATSAYGRRRSSISSIQFLEDKVSWRLRTDAVQKLEIPQSELLNPFGPISVLFMTDLCEYLYRRGFRDDNFRAMGAYNYDSSVNTLIGEYFSSLRNVGELYEALFTEIMKLFEANCTYTLKRLTPAGGIIEVHSDPDVAYELGVKHIGSSHLCSFKAGHAACMPMYLGFPMADVFETACVHRGDSCCRFEFTYRTQAS